MSTVDTYTVNCPVTTTTTTTISPTVYAYSVRLSNILAFICTDPIVTVWSTSVILTTGDTIYYDSALTTLVTGYDYVVNAAGAPDIYILDSATGIIGADTSLDC